MKWYKIDESTRNDVGIKELVDEIKASIEEHVEERIGDPSGLEPEDADDWRQLLEFICLKLKNVRVLDNVLYPTPYYDDDLELAVANLKRVENGELATTTFQKGDF